MVLNRGFNLDCSSAFGACLHVFGKAGAVCCWSMICKLWVWYWSRTSSSCKVLAAAIDPLDDRLREFLELSTLILIMQIFLGLIVGVLESVFVCALSSDVWLGFCNLFSLGAFGALAAATDVTGRESMHSKSFFLNYYLSKMPLISLKAHIRRTASFCFKPLAEHLSKNEAFAPLPNNFSMISSLWRPWTNSVWTSYCIWELIVCEFCSRGM